MKDFSVSKFLSTKYPRNERILLVVAILYLIVHFVSNVWGDFSDSNGLYLLVKIAPSFLYPAVVLYALIRRERGAYGIVFALIAFSTTASLVLLIRFINAVGVSVALGDPSLYIENWLRIASIVLALPVLVIMFRLLRPLYRERRRLRTMSDADLRTNFANLARRIYMYWKPEDLEKRHQALGSLASIRSELKRRDPALKNLSDLLTEPDDWVRITAARFLLEFDPEVALNALDTIASKNSEGSSYAKDVARKWRDGTLVRWY